MAFKQETYQTKHQIKVRLGEETFQALFDSAERKKEQHSVLGRMIIMDSLKVLCGSSADAPIAQTLKVAAETAPRIPADQLGVVKVRLTEESFQKWDAIAAKLNVPKSTLARVAIEGFLDAERDETKLPLGVDSIVLPEPHDIPPQAKVLTPDQQRIQELEARIECLEREKLILKQATAILMAD
ncbi:hypothetical protein [Pseudomonas izuensis]|uniref:hypothetical protein n=1 Tax=Pseudomonas izuensis TaxID=2684212 RepID=UPI0015B72D47